MKKLLIYNICYLKIRITQKNIYITLTNIFGNVILKMSSGMLNNILNISNKKKKTSYIARILLKEFLIKLKNKKIIIKLLILSVEGFLMYGPIKSMIKLMSNNLKIKNISFIKRRIRISHNGMRLKKQVRK